jgi:hypothetical protein
MRYDLLRDELVVQTKERRASVVLEKEKTREAWLHGEHIIRHDPEQWKTCRRETTSSSCTADASR